MRISKWIKTVFFSITLHLLSCNVNSNNDLQNSLDQTIDSDSVAPLHDAIQSNSASCNYESIPKIEYLETKSGKFGMIDENGTLLVDTIYDGNWWASMDQVNGQAMFSSGDHFKLINYKNEVIIDLTGYTGFTSSFMREKMPAIDENTGKAGYLGKGGLIMIPFKYESTNAFEKHVPLAAASINGKWGVIDEYGNWVLEPKYSHIYEIHSENSFVVLIEDGGDYYYVDKTGKIGDMVELGC